LPEALPYADCLVILRYERADEAAGDGGAAAHAPRGPLFVAAWGRRHGEATSPMTVGALHDLTLVPARDRVELERTCFSDTVGLTGDLYWADEVRVVP
jgi:hypothetical protein